MRTSASRILALLPLILLLTAWAIFVPEGSRTAFLLSTPAEIAQAAVVLIRDPVYWRDLAASGMILFGGFMLGTAAGFSAGLLGWALRRLGGILETYLVALGAVPIFAIAPLLIFILGIGAGTRIFIVTLSVFVPMALASMSAARATERNYHDILRSFPAPRWRALRLIIAPGTFFACLPSLKPAANAALVAVFLSEWISAEQGLAKFVLASMSTYRVPEMWVGLLTFIVLGVAFGGGVDLLERRITKWRVS